MRPGIDIAIDIENDGTVKSVEHQKLVAIASFELPPYFFCKKSLKSIFIARYFNFAFLFIRNCIFNFSL